MSTVIWTRIKKSDQKVSDETDHLAVYKHSNKLDKLCDQIGVKRLSEFQDHTDIAVNTLDDIGDEDVESFIEKNEKWFEISEGMKTIAALIEHLDQHQVKFGLLASTPQEEVVAELVEIREWLSVNNAPIAHFHLCVVM